MEKEKDTVQLHRLSGTDEKSIYELIDQRLEISTKDTAAVRRDKERKQNDYAQFLSEIMGVPKEKLRDRKLKRLCYEHLPELTKITGVTYKDIFREISRNPDGEYEEPRWASEVETNMCSYCDLLSSDNRKQVLSLIRSMLPDVFEDPELDAETPLKKIMKANSVRSYCSVETARQISELGVDKQYRRRNIVYSYNALELNILPYIAVNFDVSLHWLLGLDESVTVLAGNGETESIMKLFCFLPEERKNIVYNAVAFAVNEGGAL